MWEYLVIAAIAFLAFYIKGITGTGVGITLVALCSLIIEPKTVIVLKAFVAVLGGLAMVRIDPVSVKTRFWVPVAGLMIIGSIIGASLLKIIDKNIFEIILGCTFLIVSVWFLAFQPRKTSENSKMPDQSNALDCAVGGISGFLGGFVGVNAPILIPYFSRYFNKNHLRRFLVLIFIPAALAETGTFIVNGMFTKQIFLYGLAMVPGMALGIYFGNKSFHKISETWFRRILGVFLLIASVKLIL
ncbi:MAG: UPF0721 transmembrane protein [Micavibrio sp.]|nr:MAG: UPF0721 transmembrane protein [Micavibrio sp.]